METSKPKIVFDTSKSFKFDLERKFPVTRAWISKDKTNPAYEELSAVFRTGSVNLEGGQKFIEISSNYYLHDEQGQYMEQNDSRLHDKDYFVVSMDMDS